MTLRARRYDQPVVLDKLLANLSVEVSPFALCHICDGWRLRLPRPPVPLLHFVLQGEGALLGHDDTRHPIGPSYFAVVPPDCDHALESGTRIEREEQISPPPEGSPVCRLLGGPQDDARMVVACGLVTVQYGRAFSLFDHLKDVVSADLSGVPAVRAAFDTILGEQAGINPGSAALMKALMMQCMVHFFRQLGARGSLPWLDALEDERLGRAIDLILEDPAGHHTVDSLADTAAMSRSSFAEHFQTAFAQSPMAMVQYVRMQHAAQLLRGDPGLSIDNVAEKSGYSSRSHFSAAFHKHHGVSPKDFRAAV